MAETPLQFLKSLKKTKLFNYFSDMSYLDEIKSNSSHEQQTSCKALIYWSKYTPLVDAHA